MGFTRVIDITRGVQQAHGFASIPPILPLCDRVVASEAVVPLLGGVPTSKSTVRFLHSLQLLADALWVGGWLEATDAAAAARKRNGITTTISFAIIIAN